jgi:ABC-type multidrug transport system ATPase subunit
MYRDNLNVIRIRDESSFNGTYLNSPGNRIYDMVLNEDDVILLSEEYRTSGSLLLKKFLRWEESGGQVRSALAMGQVHRFNAERIYIGSSSENHIVLPYLNVWTRHAVIHREKNGVYYLEDLGGGCMVNGRTLVREIAQLHVNDAVEIGDVSISTSFDSESDVILIGAERQGFYLTAKNITYSVGSGNSARNLLENIEFSILPGEFVGLLGPSGCGKTTLLTCLSGVNPVEGVFYNGHPLLATLSQCANVIGYVPQDDVFYPELTVRESLFYSARLRLNSHTSNERIYGKIDEICRSLGLLDARAGLDLRDTPIGSPERKTLSGGQKKRVNLATELLTDPLVLFLDEPTSGLSSRDTRVVMECLRRVADEKGIPIVITIHQPALRVYKLLDHTLYLKQGQLIWFGPTYPDSVRHFVKERHESAGADEILESVEDSETEVLRQRYYDGTYAQRFIRQREQLVKSLIQGGDLSPPHPTRPLDRFTQIFYLLQRQFKRRFRDFTSLGLQIGQAPVLGLLVGIAFEGQRLNSSLFLLVFIAFWFGANAVARELVTERLIFRREKRSGVSSASTLFSKMVMQGLTMLVQCTLLLLTAHAVIRYDMNLALGLGILWTCGMCGTALGYLISALASTELAATAATPLALIPLILFGGYLTPFDDMPLPLKAVSQAIPSRWGYEAMVHAEKLPDKPRKTKGDDPYSLKRFIEFSTPKVGRIVKSDRPKRIAVCLVVLGGGIGLLTTATWVQLRRTR